MTRPRSSTLFLALVTLAVVRVWANQTLHVGIIDFYGLGRVSASEVRRALPLKEGDPISIVDDERPAILAEVERRLSRLPGVARAHAHLVCCDEGRAILYVGIEEQGAALQIFRAAPRGDVRLAADIVQAGREFSTAFMAAVQRGEAGEDASQGHSLVHDPATRSVQQRFVGYAARDQKALRRVLGESSDAGHRELAAQVLGYVTDKQDVVGDLVDAMRDSSAEVRNSAMRALAVFARAAPSAARPRVRVPYDPFIALLRSPVWTDRNKASFALVELSERRAPVLLAKLRQEAMTPLVEMARWKSEGHAMPALMILGRIAGKSDEATGSAWARGEREAVIAAALRK
jgi:hypothetical protein